MQSYLDVSLLIVIGIAVVLLLFILISFIITSRRCSNIERENIKLKADLEIAKKSLDELVEKYSPAIEALERKAKASDMSLQYLTDSQQELINKQKDINSSFDNLSVKVEQQKKEIQNNSVENQPIILAKRLLAEGMSVEQVIAKTGLPQYEVEMLAKVHNLSAKVAAAEKAAANATKEETKSPETALAKKEVVSSDNNKVAAVGQDAGHHVANLKAREAYGITTAKTGLRRQR